MSTVTEKVADAAATAVNEVTNALADTSLTGKAPEDKPAANNDAVLASAAEGRRLYIGNLAYATTEGELKDFFKGYLVESVSIPKNPRTDRPVGYAFVDLSTPSEAERAIAELSGKEILERKVSVQLARKPESSDKTGGTNAEAGAEGSRRRQNARGRGRAARGRGGRARGGRGSTSGDEHKEGDAPAQDAAGTSAAQPEALKDVTNVATGDKEKEGKPAKAQTRASGPRQRGPPEDGIASKTKIMVANLPYDLSDEALKQYFADYQPVSAKLALRPIPRFMIKKLQARGEARKSRGFGFVVLPSEELQQKAIAEMNGKVIAGREISVKVAVDSPDKTDDEVKAPETEAAPAATNGAEQAEAGPATASAS